MATARGVVSLRSQPSSSVIGAASIFWADFFNMETIPVPDVPLLIGS